MTGIVPKLNSDDYYRYNAPFRQWLFESKDKQLSNYKTEEAKLVFEREFVPLWNNDKLPGEFYTKGPNMKTNFIKTDKKRPESSFGFTKQEESRLFAHKVPKSTSSSSSSSSSSYVSRTGPVPYDKSFQKRRTEDFEDLIPKKEGHAKVIEDRRIKSAYTRNERNPLDLEISDDQLLSGSVAKRSSNMTDDYESLLRMERDKRARKEQEIQSRKAEKQRELQDKIDRHNQREKEVQEMLKKMINNKK